MFNWLLNMARGKQEEVVEDVVEETEKVAPVRDADFYRRHTGAREDVIYE